MRVEGNVKRKKKIQNKGKMIEKIDVRFEGGSIVEERERSGEEVI